LTVEDYQWATKALQEVCERVKQGEWKKTDV
jgi:hypothetical protein